MNKDKQCNRHNSCRKLSQSLNCFKSQYCSELLQTRHQLLTALPLYSLWVVIDEYYVNGKLLLPEILKVIVARRIFEVEKKKLEKVIKSFCDSVAAFTQLAIAKHGVNCSLIISHLTNNSWMRLAQPQHVDWHSRLN